MIEYNHRRKKEIMDNFYEDTSMPKYPYESVISFVFNYAPKSKPRCDVKILEVGFGAGNNLWFAAREGFSVYGIELSQKAVEFAQKRFENDGLNGDLRIGDFTELPYEDEYFDLVIDRGALTCVDLKTQKRSVNEILRVLKKGGKFHYNCLSDAHSAYRSALEKGLEITSGIRDSKLGIYKELFFGSRKDIDYIFSDGWNIITIFHNMKVGMYKNEDKVIANWLVIAEKK